MLRKFFVAIPIAVLGIGGTTACATKKFVRTSVGEVNEKVDSQGRAIEETQERTRKNEGRIAEVDQKAAAADAEGSRGEPGGAGGPHRGDTPSAPRPTPSSTRSTRTASGWSTKSC